MMHRAGYIERGEDCMHIRIPGLGSFTVGLQEMSRLINKGQVAPVVATYRHEAAVRNSCWFEAGSMYRSRSGRALIFTTGRRRYIVPTQSISLLLSHQKRYAVLATMAGPVAR